MLIECQELTEGDVVIADSGAHMLVSRVSRNESGVFIMFADGLFTTLPRGTQVTAVARPRPAAEEAANVAAYDQAKMMHRKTIARLVELYRKAAAERGEMEAVAGVSGHIQRVMMQVGDPVRAAQFCARQQAFMIAAFADKVADLEERLHAASALNPADLPADLAADTRPRCAEFDQQHGTECGRVVENGMCPEHGEVGPDE